ncbi:rRNA-processing protein efg1 domain-containing protein [Hirsutella rhossiliensis]|uniref:rRNA-processing protein EFG1 n=1 Tax=Hirsutella rhossiliensis TaxID=111463 RepID=A0A9P8MXG1_9HYPO|nr:rRNA-processing protein efg1 domain-containing protein [Hirsutella rhossiliensis]KAH0963025.1 rRNA-processing protein efg1 domain-containing protein [Hirsutella rhossiliensis]
MGIKRPFAEVGSRGADDDNGADPSSLDNTKRRKQLGKAKHKARQGTSEFSKKRARNIQRLLQRKQDLPANVVNDLERELEAHKADLDDKAFQRKRSAMIAKYHMVRFFERRKASRLVKQLKRQMEQTPESDDTDRLKQDLHTAEVDEAYTLYFPHLESYVSLYGSALSAEADEGGSKTPSAKVSLRAERPPMWSVVERTLAEGPEALRRLREAKPAGGKAVEKTPKRQQLKVSATASNAGGPPPPQKQHKEKGPSRKDGKTGVPSTKDGAAPQLNRRERRRLMHQAKAATEDEDGEDGGGFFEDM